MGNFKETYVRFGSDADGATIDTMLSIVDGRDRAYGKTHPCRMRFYQFEYCFKHVLAACKQTLDRNQFRVDRHRKRIYLRTLKDLEQVKIYASVAS